MNAGADQLLSNNGVLAGKDGELFLSGGNHAVLRFAKGEVIIRADSIENLKTNLQERRAFFTSNGIAYGHLIAPEKYRVVEEKFPLSPVYSILDQYVTGGCEGIIDPTEEMRAEEEGENAYYHTDTHWSVYGQIIAARIIARLHAPLRERLAEIEAEVRASLKTGASPFSGDLGRKFNPPIVEERKVLQLPHKVATYENGLPHDYERPVNDGRMVLVESEAPSATGRLLIFGDSYLHQSLDVLSYFFKTVVFCRTRWMHREVVGMVSPDVVVTQQAERYLGYVYPDHGAPPFFLIPSMLGRTPAPSYDEAIALARALSAGRTVDLRPFARP